MGNRYIHGMRLKATRSFHRTLLHWGIDLVRVGDRASHVKDISAGLQDAGMLMSGCEAAQLIFALRATERLMGAVAEVGVFRGGSAKLLAINKGDRDLHLFDTFEGLPELTQDDHNSSFWAGEFAASLPAVQKYLSGYPGIRFHQGLFPDSAEKEGLGGIPWSFVHLDVDLYEPMRNSIGWFLGRLQPGGIIACHDYWTAPPVQNAIRDAAGDRDDVLVLPTSGDHCLLVRCAG